MSPAIESNLSLHTYGPGQWRPPIVKTMATTGMGVADLVTAIAAFRAHTEAANMSRRGARGESRIRELVAERLMARLDTPLLTSLVARVAAREIDPYSAADQLVASIV